MELELSYTQVCASVQLNIIELHYYLMSITPGSGQCKLKYIKTLEWGVATAFTYDSSQHVIHFGWNPNGNNRLYSLYVQKGYLLPYDGVELNPPAILEDLEVKI
jgi:hypothetical protein